MPLCGRRLFFRSYSITQVSTGTVPLIPHFNRTEVPYIAPGSTAGPHTANRRHFNQQNLGPTSPRATREGCSDMQTSLTVLDTWHGSWPAFPGGGQLATV